MASFSAILSSLQDGDAQIAKPIAAAPRAAQVITNSARPASTTTAAGSKRKNDLADTTEPRKSPKMWTGQGSTVATTYQGTLKTAAKAQSKPIPKFTHGPPTQEKPGQPNNPPAAPSQAKRGFASLMAKAQAAQDAAKAAGPDTIKHKATTVLSKKDRIRMTQEDKAKDVRGKSLHATVLGKQGNGSDMGVMRKQAVNGNTSASRPIKEKISYTGTMRASSGKQTTKNSRLKGVAQDKYGGYASWSDLDAEDEDGEDGDGYYDSESDMEEAGFDEMLNEERQAERIARQEDQREHEEEERRRREKMERKRRLEALSSNAAAKKRI